MRFFENQSLAYVELSAAFWSAAADAAHKFGLIKTIAKQDPKALQIAVETPAKTANLPALWIAPKE